MATTRPNDDTQPTPPASSSTSSPSASSEAFDRNPVHRSNIREIGEIERVLDGTDNNPNRMPLTPEGRRQLETRLATLKREDVELAKRLTRADIVEGDPYGRTREEIDGETRRLRG